MVALVIVAIIGLQGLFHSENFGYTTVATTALRYPNSYVDAAHGYYVDSVAVIDGNGQISTTGTTTMETSAGRFGIGTSSPDTLAKVAIGASGTTTLTMQSSTAATGACIEMMNSAGTISAITVDGTTLVVKAARCRTGN